MKLQKTHLLFIAALIVLMPFFAMPSTAATYSVNIVQDPIRVYAGETLVITVTVLDMIRDEEITSARLSPKVDGIVQSTIACEETIPTLNNVVTFVIGPFEENIPIAYKIYLEFQLTSDYFGEWHSFTVRGTRSVLSNLQIMYICLGSAGVVVIAAVCIIILRKRR